MARPSVRSNAPQGAGVLRLEPVRVLTELRVLARAAAALYASRVAARFPRRDAQPLLHIRDGLPAVDERHQRHLRVRQVRAVDDQERTAPRLIEDEPDVREW